MADTTLQAISSNAADKTMHDQALYHQQQALRVQLAAEAVVRHR